GGQPEPGQEREHGLGAAVTQREVVLGGAALVRVALDAEPDLGAGTEDRSLLAEQLLGLGTDARLVVVEVHPLLEHFAGLADQSLALGGGGALGGFTGRGLCRCTLGGRYGIAVSLERILIGGRRSRWRRRITTAGTCDQRGDQHRHCKAADDHPNSRVETCSGWIRRARWACDATKVMPFYLGERPNRIYAIIARDAMKIDS